MHIIIYGNSDIKFSRSIYSFFKMLLRFLHLSLEFVACWCIPYIMDRYSTISM